MRRFASPLIAAALIAATLFTALADSSVGLIAGQVAEVPPRAPGLPVEPTHPLPGIALAEDRATQTPARPVPVLDATQDREPLVPTRPGCDNPEQGPDCVRQAYVVVSEPIGPASLVPDAVTSVDDWRPLVASYFEAAEVERALDVVRCESGGDPSAKNPYSTASGLFQHLGSYWGERSAKAGISGADIFDPVANVTVAAWLVYEGGGWSHWYPSRPCWNR